MKFTLHHYADISTEYLEESDLALILSPQAPNLMAVHTDLFGSFFYPPDSESPEAVQHFSASARSHGLSEKFIQIILLAGRQGIPYVRFDSSGGEIEGLLEADASYKPNPDQCGPESPKCTHGDITWDPLRFDYGADGTADVEQYGTCSCGTVVKMEYAQGKPFEA